MQRILTALACLALGTALADPTAAPVRTEIDALLTTLQSSGCAFNRNGTWHGAAEAKGHLLRKLDYIEGKSTVKSTEQFIELAATKSSSSGKPYQVRCGSAVVDSQPWLTRQLAALRSARAKGRP
jgi:Family of unknown function (DUF5329)